MAAMEAHLPDLSPPDERSTPSLSPLTTGTSSPIHEQSPTRAMDETQRKRQQRHSKRLSINFPILIPARGHDISNPLYTASPTSSSAHPSSYGAFFSPPMTHASHTAVPSSIAVSFPLTPPSEEDPAYIIGGGEGGRARSKSRSHLKRESTSAEFLTLLASQERRVLELREELSRAETELSALKKHWAYYEANKKKDESVASPVRATHNAPRRARPASVIEVGNGLGLTGFDESASEERSEAERERRREMALERLMGRGSTSEESQTANSGTKKSGQRVFKSSRHTRTLSLLATTTTTNQEQSDSSDKLSNTKTSLDSARQSSAETPTTATTPSVPMFSRTNSGLDALNFGKTYKELASAASKKNLPQGLSPEQFVKQGKQMVDGVRDGLWNFFEDIRQATVGDEAINGPGAGVRRQNSTSGGSGSTKLKRAATDAGTRTKKDRTGENDSSFWKEFGMDTPKSDKVNRETDDTAEKEKEKRPNLPGRWPSTKTGEDFEVVRTKHKARENQVSPKKSRSTKKVAVEAKRKDGHEHHDSKSSTDPRHPPSLVSDLQDEDEESWGWDSTTDPGSPHSTRKRSERKSAGTAAAVEKEVHWHDLVS